MGRCVIARSRGNNQQEAVHECFNLYGIVHHALLLIGRSLCTLLRACSHGVGLLYTLLYRTTGTGTGHPEVRVAIGKHSHSHLGGVLVGLTVSYYSHALSVAVL